MEEEIQEVVAVCSRKRIAGQGRARQGAPEGTEREGERRRAEINRGETEAKRKKRAKGEEGKTMRKKRKNLSSLSDYLLFTA